MPNLGQSSTKTCIVIGCIFKMSSHQWSMKSMRVDKLRCNQGVISRAINRVCIMYFIYRALVIIRPNSRHPARLTMLKPVPYFFFSWVKSFYLLFLHFSYSLVIVFCEKCQLLIVSLSLVNSFQLSSYSLVNEIIFSYLSSSLSLTNITLVVTPP